MTKHPETGPANGSAPARRLRVSALSAEQPTPFRLEPPAGERHEIAAALGLTALRRLAFTGTIAPEGDADWRLDATLGATVVQPSVVSLAPVTTRIDETVTRRFLAEMPASAPAGDTPEGGVEIPGDDSIEPLGREIDLWEVMLESLALALPVWPRAAGETLGTRSFAPPGETATETKEERPEHPFAALSALRDKLENGD